MLRALLALALLALPAVAQNLLTSNPSFESASGSFFNGSYSITGWSGNNPRFGSHGVESSGLYPGTGSKAWRLRYGGTLTTATANRADVVGGRTYLFSFLTRKTQDESPGQRIGLTGVVLFYDAGGAQVGQVTSGEALESGIADWKVVRVLAPAPLAAVKAAVRLTFSTGAFPNNDLQTFHVDDARLEEFVETDALGFRRVPMVITGGESVVANVKYRLSTDRDLLVRLLEGGGLVSEQRVSVTRRRGAAAAVPFTIPVGAVASENYSWEARLVPTAGAWEDGVAAAAPVTGVFLDDTVMTGNQITPDNPHVHLDGRWSGTGTTRSFYWLGSSVNLRFTGTSLGIRYSFSSSDSADRLDLLVSIDGAAPVSRVLNQGANLVVNLASGLPPGIHTAAIIRNGPETRAHTLSRIDLDAGAGLLRHRPHMNRRVHAYGDSTASGSSGGMYVNYTGTSARVLGAPVSVVSKGGTGISGGFIFENNGLYYWDRRNFNAFYDPTPDESGYPRNPYTVTPVIDPTQTRGGAWGPGNFDAYGDPNDWSEIPNKGNFTNDVPDVVLLGWGQNDQFGGGPFSSNYRQFIILQKKLFPNAHFFFTHTHMTSPGYVEGAADAVMNERHIGGLNADGRIHFVPHFGLASASGSGGHPSGAQNQELALGSSNNRGLVDVIEDTLGWSGTPHGDSFEFTEPAMSPPPTRYDDPQMVTLTTFEGGASFRYTTDGSWPSATNGTLYTGPFSVSATTTVKAIAYGAGLLDSPIVTKTYTIAAATPTASPVAGTYDEHQTVALSTTTPGAEIRYTLDGSTPTASSALYTAPLSITATTTLKAIAIKAGIGNSGVLTATFTIQAAAPTAAPAPGSYGAAQDVTLTTTTPGAEIRFTTDGSTPTAASTLHTGPVNLTSTTTLKAIAIKPGIGDSPVFTGVYTLTINAAAAPVFSPPAGIITEPTDITLTTATTGAGIRYTTDGSDPSDTLGTLYTGPFSISATTTVKAIAFMSGLANSTLATATYTFQENTVTRPVISPDGGAFTGPVSVTLSTTTPGAGLRYTLDGTDPSDLEGILYTGPFIVAVNTSVKAVGFKDTMTNSFIAAADFAILADAPVITPSSGIFAAPLVVSMSTATIDGEIRFTTDGSAPTAASTLYTGPFALNAGATLKAFTRFGPLTDSPVTTAALTVYSNLSGWRAAYSLPGDGSQDLATPAGDGTPNLLKYALGMDPLDQPARVMDTNGVSGLPRMDADAANFLFTYVRRKSNSSPGIVYLPQGATNLPVWTNVTTPPAQTVDLNPVWERVTHAMPLGSGAGFMRVMVEVATPGILTLAPVADSYVHNANPSSNFGTAATIDVKVPTSSPTSSVSRYGHLRFDLSGITGPVQSAVLRLTTSSVGTESTATPNVSIREGTSDTWTETGINWNNRPAQSGTIRGSVNAAAPGTVTTLDITAYVNAQLAATDTVLSLSLNAMTGNDRLVRFHSRETAVEENRPQLIVTP